MNKATTDIDAQPPTVACSGCGGSILLERAAAQTFCAKLRHVEASLVDAMDDKEQRFTFCKVCGRDVSSVDLSGCIYSTGFHVDGAMAPDDEANHFEFEDGGDTLTFVLKGPSPEQQRLFPIDAPEAVMIAYQLLRFAGRVAQAHAATPLLEGETDEPWWNNEPMRFGTRPMPS